MSVSVQTLGSLVVLSLITITCAKIWDDEITVTNGQLRGLRMFQDNTDSDDKYYNYLYVDKDNDDLYVGAMEYIYRLNLDDISSQSMKSPRMEPSSRALRECQGSHANVQESAYKCKNHIRSIYKLADGTIAICGTSAFKPQTYQLTETQLGYLTIPSGFASTYRSGQGLCPENPDDRATSVYVRMRHGEAGKMPFDEGYPPVLTDGAPDDHIAQFAATSGISDSMIYRPDLPDGNSFIRTVKHNTDWLNNPRFVKALDSDDHVYFFFCEESLEDDSVMISRVARVCKNDQSSSNSGFRNQWTSYLKAEIECVLPGSPAFKLNEIRDVEMVDGKFYGLFAAKVTNGLYTYNYPGNETYVSAVCSFTIDENGDVNGVKEVFGGSFKDRVIDSPRPHPGRSCTDSLSLSQSSLSFRSNHQEMESAVHDEHPKIMMSDVSFTHLQIDVVNVQSGEYTVMFLATDDGRIAKILGPIDNDTPFRLLAVYQPFTSDVKIHNMVLVDDELYLTSDNAVVQIPKDQCAYYESCTECAVDPYCGWDRDRCRKYRSSLTQAVEGDAFEQCGTKCSLFNGIRTEVIRVKGDGIHLACSTPCQTSEEIRWYKESDRLPVQSHVTDSHGLVLLNITEEDRGTYICYAGNVQLAEYYVNVPNCGNESDCWLEEFRKWCDEFQTYSENIQQWRCMKDTCDQCDTCGLDTSNYQEGNCEAPVR